MVGLLTREHIWGERALDTIKRNGIWVPPSDLAILLGGLMSNHCRTIDGSLMAYSWTASPSFNKWDHGVCCVGITDSSFTPNMRAPTIRPVLSVDEASKIPANVVGEFASIPVCQYGEYPQMVASKVVNHALEMHFQEANLKTTGKNYTFDSADILGGHLPFQANLHPEYVYRGKKYVRVIAQPVDDDSCLSTGQHVEDEKAYWVQVQDIDWLMDPSGLRIAKRALLAGIQFDKKNEYDGRFETTFMYDYLNTYFIKEIQPSILSPQKTRGVFSFRKRSLVR